MALALSKSQTTLARLPKGEALGKGNSDLGTSADDPGPLIFRSEGWRFNMIVNHRHGTIILRMAYLHHFAAHHHSVTKLATTNLGSVPGITKGPKPLSEVKPRLVSALTINLRKF